MQRQIPHTQASVETETEIHLPGRSTELVLDIKLEIRLIPI